MPGVNVGYSLGIPGFQDRLLQAGGKIGLIELFLLGSQLRRQVRLVQPFTAENITTATEIGGCGVRGGTVRTVFVKNTQVKILSLAKNRVSNRGTDGEFALRCTYRKLWHATTKT